MIPVSTISEFDVLPIDEQQKVLQHLAQMDNAMSLALEAQCEETVSPGSLRASSLHYYLRCPHRAFLDMLCVAKKDVIPAKLRWIFDFGTMIHELMQEGLNNEDRTHPLYAYLDLMTGDGEWLVERQDEPEVWYEPLLMSGHSDSCMVVRHSVYKLRAGLEIKSINDAGFKQRERMKVPKPEHVDQGLFYQKTLDLPVMNFFYVNKNTAERLVIPYPFDQKRWDEIEKQVGEIVAAAAEQESLGMVTGRHCRECPFNPLSCQPGKYTRKA